MIERSFFSLLFTLLILVRSLNNKSLSKDGCVAAFFVGLIVSFSSLCHFAILFTFFLVCSRATKFRQTVKQKFDAEFKEGGQRDSIQVLCNGFLATFFSLTYMYFNGYGERKLDFVNDFEASFSSLAVIASLSCSCGDTLASEIGTAFEKKSQAYLISNLRKVPKGTNGGISVIGTLASIFGGLIIGLVYFIVLKICLYYQDENIESYQWQIVLVGTLSGFIGSLIDSLLGSCLQYSGYNLITKKISNSPGSNIKHISGYNFLTNNQVNFISSLLTTLIVPYLTLNLF